MVRRNVGDGILRETRTRTDYSQVFDVPVHVPEPESNGIGDVLVKMKLDCCHPWRLVLFGLWKASEP